MRRAPNLLTDGTVDVTLALLIAALGVALGWHVGSPLSIALDVAACAAAALTVRYPRAAGIALAAILLCYVPAPKEWALMGEYAPLIPILGMGMRGRRHERLVMTIVYWSILMAIQVAQSARVNPDAPGIVLVLAGFMWAALMAVLWVIGSVFTAYRKAQDEARAAALAQQRLSLARDLHDSLARTLAHLILRARKAAAAGDTDALEPLADGISQAASELRWLLGALREPGPLPDLDTGGSLAATITEVIDELAEHGFPTAVTIDGDLDRVPPRTGEVLAGVAREAAANIERHGAEGRPCTLVASIDENAVDLAFINEVGSTGRDSGSGSGSMGLLGATERLATVGGTMETRREGRQWITRVTIPLAGQS